MFSHQIGMKLEINYREKNRKKHKHMETKQHSTKHPMAQQKNERTKEYAETSEHFQNFTHFKAYRTQHK